MLRRIFFKHLGKKSLAFVVAIALWFAANIEQDIERNMPVGVSYASLPDDLVIMNQPPETLNVRVRGSRNQLASLSPRDIGIVLDLSQVSTGVSRFEIQTGQIKAPIWVQVVGISPAEIRLDVDALVEKKLDVKPVIGIPDTGYEIVGEPKVSPSQVTAVGPERVVSGMEAIPTDLITTTGVKSDFTIEVPLKTPPHVEVVGGDTARVTVNVKEKVVAKEFKGINIDLVNFNNVSFETADPLKAELEFEGPYSTIRDLNNNDIKVFIDGSSLDEGNGSGIHRLEVSVSYPDDKSITLKKKKPDKVEIKLQ